MDKLKQYLSENREELAIEEAPDELWPQINQQLQPKRSLVVPMMKWVAAASVIILAGVGVYYLTQNEADREVVKTETTPPKADSNKNVVSEKKEVPVEITKPVEEQKQQLVTTGAPHQKSLTRQKPNNQENNTINEVDLLQQNFAVMIKHQEEKIRNTPIYAEDAEYFHFFKKQLDEMSGDEKNLKDEVKKTGWTDYSIERLINIYQGKIALLKQLQFEINKMNNKAKQNNSTIQTQKPSFINI